MCADNLIPQKRRKNYKVGGGELRGTSSLATHSCQATTIPSSPSFSSLSPPRPSPTRHLDLATPFLLFHLSSLSLCLSPRRSFHPFSLCLCFSSSSSLRCFSFFDVYPCLYVSRPLNNSLLHTQARTHTHHPLATVLSSFSFSASSLFLPPPSPSYPPRRPHPAKFATRGGIGRGASFSPEFRIVGGGDTRHRPRNLFAVCADDAAGSRSIRLMYRAISK